MTELERAIDTLKAAVKQGGIDKRVGDVVNQLTSYLVLLKSSSPSSQSIAKLRSILRRPLVPLYIDFPGPALQLSSAILRKVIDEKLRNALNAQNSQLSALWNEVAVALLSGVLDFLESNCDDLSKETTASAFYPTICTLFFYQDTNLILSPRTQTTAYSLLQDTLVKHPGNQRRLRDPTVLGGSLIGYAISQSKDYLVIEALLNIVGWLIPPTNKTEQGKAKRTEFIQELFGSDKQYSCSQELVDILQYINSSHWEDTAMKILDALARSDIMFPQPFALDEVTVCGKSYPQPTAFDRLHLDRDCFLVNVIKKDDVCESLKIPYSHIRSVTIDTSNAPPPNKATVHVDLVASPIMGEVSLDVMAGQNLYLKFEVQREDLSSLMEALRRRGVVKLNFLGENIPKQITKRKSVAIAHSIRLPGDSSPSPQDSQYEEKVKHVENVYETNVPDDARPISANPEPEPLPMQQVPSRTPKSRPDIHRSGKHTGAKCAPKAVPRPRPVSKSKSMNNVAPFPVTSPRKNPAIDIPPRAVHASVFGESDEELSELSDDPAPKTIAKVRILSAKNVKAKPALDLSPSDSIPPLPMTRRTAKRRLVVDSDEEVQVTPKAPQRTAVATSKRDTKAETTLGKTHRIHKRPSFTIQSSSPIEDADHPEITSPVVLQKPSTPSSNKIPPGPVEIAAEARLSEDAFLMETSAYDQVPQCEGIPAAKLSPKATAKPISPAKKNSVAGKGSAHHISSSGPAICFNVPAKLTGTRRKREDANFPAGVPVASGDDHPPKKKARNTTSGDIEIKRNSDEVTFSDPFESTSVLSKKAKKYGKKGKVSSPISLENIDFDEVPGAGSKGKANARAKPARAASKAVPKKTPARQTRTNPVRRKNKKLAEFESPKGVSSKLETPKPEAGILTAPKPADRTIEVVFPNNPVTNDFFAPFKPESASTKQADRTIVSTIAPKDLIKNKISNAAITESSAQGRSTCPPKPKRTPWEDPVFIAQHVSSDEVKPFDAPEEVPLEPIQDVAPEETCEVLFDDYIEYSMSLKESDDPILPASLISPPLPSTTRNPPICIDLTQNLTPVKNCKVSAKGAVAKNVQMLANKDVHLAESINEAVAVPDALHDTRRQDEHSARIGVPEAFIDDAMRALVSKNPSPMPDISPQSEEQQEPLAVSTLSLAVARANDAEDYITKPRDKRHSLPAFPARQKRLAVSFASPLVTRSNSKDTFQVSSIASLTPDIPSTNCGQGSTSVTGIHEVNILPPNGSILDRGISLAPGGEIESPRLMRKLASDRVRFDDTGLQPSPSPFSLKTNLRPAKQTSAQNPLENRAKNSRRNESYHKVKSDEDHDIQDIVNVLSDIQTVIVNGIANKFSTVDKDVRVARDELLYEAAEDLQALADVYARQFNSFIALEEDYSKYRATMARHWEGLIKSSEHLQDDLKKALQTHDRNISSKVFPKSLLPSHFRFSKH